MARAAGTLDNAERCPVCQDVHMLSYPSKKLDNCKKFRELSPKHKGIILEEQNGCLLCTSYTHNRIRCYQRRRSQTVTTCGVSEDDKDVKEHQGQDGAQPSYVDNHDTRQQDLDKGAASQTDRTRRACRTR